jgi:hypothetical protein
MRGEDSAPTETPWESTMRTRRLPIGFTAAVLLALIFGTARSALAWDCTQLTGGGGGTWLCSEGNDWWYVDCSAGEDRCVYQKF